MTAEAAAAAAAASVTLRSRKHHGAVMRPLDDGGEAGSDCASVPASQ